MGVGTTQTRNHTKSQCPDSVGRTSLTKHREIENKRKDFRSGCKERKKGKKKSFFLAASMSASSRLTRSQSHDIPN